MEDNWGKTARALAEQQAEHKAQWSEEKLAVMNRQQRRKVLIRHGSGGMYSRFTSGARTGTTPHFARWQAEGRIKSSLQKISLTKLIDAAPDVKTSAAYAMLRGTEYCNAWAISTANRRHLLRIDGMGPAKLRLIHEHLTSHGVRLTWEA